MSPQIAIVLVAVFVSIALALGVVASLVFRWSTPESREIRKLAGVVATTCSPTWSSPRSRHPGSNIFNRSRRSLRRRCPSLRRRLTAAGYRSLTAAILYGAAEMILPFVFGASTPGGRVLEMVRRAARRRHRLRRP